MALRPPSLDPGVTSFAWTMVFVLFLFFGSLSIGIDLATAFIVSGVAGLFIFLFIRLRGEEEIRRR